MKNTVGKFPKPIEISLKEEKLIELALKHIYMTVNFPGLVQTLQ